MKIVDLDRGGARVVTFNGEMDPGEISDLRSALEDIHRYSETLIDLAGVEFIPTSFVALLIKVKNDRPGLYERIKLLNPGELPRKIIDLSQLNRFYAVRNIFPTAW